MNREEKQFVAYKYLINKMLKKYNVDFDYVVANPEIEGQPWFTHYTWTEDEQEAFRAEATDYIRQTLHMSKKQSELSIAMLLLNHGLKTIYNEQRQ